MKSEKTIQKQLDRMQQHIEEATGHDKSHRIGYRNALEWVLDDGDDSIKPNYGKIRL